jgi:KaiC/GvpD/RAD55 family RecA-like ATPase
MLTFGWDREESERVEMLDCYSWRQGDEFSIDLRRLTEAGMKISDFFANYQNANLVVDSFTDFLLNNEAEVALRFLSQLKGKLQPRKITTLVILEEGPHRQEISATAEYIADGTIRTRYDETGRYLMVSRMLATPVQLGWSKFTIQKGIDVVVRNFFGGGGA